MNDTAIEPWPTVIHMFADAMERAPDTVALVAGDRQLTYRHYHACVADLAADLAADLVETGIGPGSRVALLMGNSPDIAIATFGVQAAGAQVVPLNPAYTAAELRPILADADPAVLLHDEALGELVSGVAPDAMQRIAIGAGARQLDRPRRIAPSLPDMPHADMLSTLQYTGGTTGVAKGVDLTHGAIAANIAQREALLPTRDDERVLAITPLFHSYAVAMGLYLTANCRGTLVIAPKYQADNVLAQVTQHRITFLLGSPTIFQGLMAADGFDAADFGSLRVASSGSAALSEDVLRRWEDATGCVVCEGYGQTEAGPVLTHNPLAGPRRIGTVGPPLPGTKVQIVDVETGRTQLPVGDAGEIRAQGPQIMTGYRGRSDETAQALRDGWLHTGDIGRFDEAGYLVICDRKKEMVVTAGYNVFPREVEEVLFAAPGVIEAAVVGMPDSYRGEMLVAYLVSEEASPSPDGIMDHLAGQLTKYKWPRDIRFLDALPKTAVGKTDKNALRRLAAAGMQEEPSR